MKTIVEYINEGLRLDEAKNVKKDDLLKELEQIAKWNNENNIKKLMISYSPEDSKVFGKSHWKACEEAVAWVSDILRTFVDNEDDKVIDLSGLSDWVADTIDNESYDNELNEMDDDSESSPWDTDAIINLFNTVSTKVCKEVWLI
jgi:hypothetical protein